MSLRDRVMSGLLLMTAALALDLAACSKRPASLPPGGPSPSPSAAPSASPTASPSASPTATPTGAPGSFPASIVNNDPAIASANITLYIYGQDPSTKAFRGVNADGSTYALNVGSSVTPIRWLGGSLNSETVFLPALIGGRVYIVDGTTLSSIFTVQAPAPPALAAGPSAPAPWTKDGSKNVYFDNVEYSETSPGSVNYDLSQTDALGLDLEVTTTGAKAPPPIGFMSGAITDLSSKLGLLGAPWSTLVQNNSSGVPIHILNPQHFSPNPTFLDGAIMSAWNAYAGQWMKISATSVLSTGYVGDLYGTVDASGNFDFYNAQSTSSTLIGTIESPQTYASKGEPVTEQMLAQNGVFSDFTTPYAIAALGPAVGNRLSGALNSGVMQPAASPSPSPGAPLTVQPVCTGRFPSAPYQNQYADALHNVANTYAYLAGSAYGYPYDDLCGTSTDSTVTGITQMTITINPS